MRVTIVVSLQKAILWNPYTLLDLDLENLNIGFVGIGICWGSNFASGAQTVPDSYTKITIDSSGKKTSVIVPLQGTWKVIATQ